MTSIEALAIRPHDESFTPERSPFVWPAQNPAQSYRLLTGGLDEIWSRPESVRLAA